MFERFIEAMRGVVPQTKIVDKNGNPITDENINELKKSELIDYIDLLEQDRAQNKIALDNLGSVEKAFSKDFLQEAESMLLTKISNITQEIEKAKKKVEGLKMKFADAIVYNHEGKILFLRRKNDAKRYPGVLGLPGGHVDPGEDFETAAKRELKEETNLEITNCYKVGEFTNKDVHICYYRIDVDLESILILEANEHANLCWKHLKDLDENDAIPNLKNNLTEFLEPTEWAVKIIKKGFDLGLIGETSYLESLKKAKQAQVGEIREWNGQKMRKEASGWVPVTDGKGGKAEDDKKKGPGAKREEDRRPASKSPEGEGPTPEQLAVHAKETSTESLQNVAEDKNADPAMVEAANAELMERGVGPSVRQRLKEKAKDWHRKQVDFYQSGALNAGSEDRKGLAGYLAKKRDGIIHAVKDEIKEFKEAGTGLKKFFSGNKDQITDHEKKAIKTISIHLGVVIGSMALTGGLAGAASKGLAALTKGIVAHYFEHAGLMRLGHVLAFAKAEDALTDEELDEVLGKLIDEILAHIENGNIDEEAWMDMGDSASGDFESLLGEEDEEESKKETKKQSNNKKENKPKE